MVGDFLNKHKGLAVLIYISTLVYRLLFVRLYTARDAITLHFFFFFFFFKGIDIKSHIPTCKSERKT